MYQPEFYWVALLFMLMSMLCWGSWANTMKLTPGYSFQLFYWDYVIGVVLGSLLWGLSLGNLGGGQLSFLANVHTTDTSHILFAMAGGVVFNIANLLLVAAIEIAGLAVAFPVGIGLALVVGVLLNYAISPKGNPILLFGGMVLVIVAIVLDALAYFRRENIHRSVSKRGIWLSVACGLLMGIFYPLVTRAQQGNAGLGPYTVVVFFSLGIALCALPVNFLLMEKPLTPSPAVTMSQYFQTRTSWHVWGALGGFIWCTGMVFNIIASNAHIIGPAVSYAIGQGATMVSAMWGVFIWKEFAQAPAASRKLIPAMFVLFILGLGSIALAPMVTH